MDGCGELVRSKCRQLYLNCNKQKLKKWNILTSRDGIKKCSDIKSHEYMVKKFDLPRGGSKCLPKEDTFGL